MGSQKRRSHFLWDQIIPVKQAIALSNQIPDKYYKQN